MRLYQGRLHKDTEYTVERIRRPPGRRMGRRTVRPATGRLASAPGMIMTPAWRPRSAFTAQSGDDRQSRSPPKTCHRAYPVTQPRRWPRARRERCFCPARTSPTAEQTIDRTVFTRAGRSRRGFPAAFGTACSTGAGKPGSARDPRGPAVLRPTGSVRRYQRCHFRSSRVRRRERRPGTSAAPDPAREAPPLPVTWQRQTLPGRTVRRYPGSATRPASCSTGGSSEPAADCRSARNG